MSRIISRKPQGHDLREHEANGSCWCKPTLDDGVWLHHSMDGRESFETGERQPS